MSASIVVLKTGEQLICELKEAFDGEGEERKGICLVMIHPYILELVKVENLDNPEQDLQVRFSKWVPYAIDTQFKIPYDTVTAIGTPDSGLERAYFAKVEQVTGIPPEAIDQPVATSPVEVVADGQGPTNIDLQQQEIQKAVSGFAS